MAAKQKPTREYSPQEQYEAGKAVGLSDNEMLANVKQRAKILGDSLARFATDSIQNDYADRKIDEIAADAKAVRQCYRFMLNKILRPGSEAEAS